MTGHEWKNLLSANGGIKTKDLSTNFTNANNELFVDLSKFIGNDICIRMLLEVTNNSDTDAIIVAISNTNGDTIQTIRVNGKIKETYNLTSALNIKIYVSGTNTTLTLRMN